MYNTCVSLHKLTSIKIWYQTSWWLGSYNHRPIRALLFRASTFHESETLALLKRAARSGYGPTRAQSVSFFTFLRWILILLNFSWLMFYAVQYVKFWCCCRFRSHANYWFSCTWTVAHFHIAVLPDRRNPKKENKKRKMDLVRWLFRMIGSVNIQLDSAFCRCLLVSLKMWLTKYWDLIWTADVNNFNVNDLRCYANWAVTKERPEIFSPKRDSTTTTATTTTVSFIFMTITIQHCKSIKSMIITVI